MVWGGAGELMVGDCADVLEGAVQRWRVQAAA